MNHRHYLEVLPGGHCFKCHQTYTEMGTVHYTLCEMKDADATPGMCNACRDFDPLNPEKHCPMCKQTIPRKLYPKI